MADKLAFVETPAQLYHVGPEYHVISLSPLAEVALEETGRSYSRPEDYLDEMILEREGVDNFVRVENLCDVLDGIFAEAVGEVDQKGLRPARWNFFWLKMVFDAFFLRARQLRRVMTEESPREVLYFRGEPPDLKREWISQCESLYGQILEAVLPQLEVSGKALGPVPGPTLPRCDLPLPGWPLAGRLRRLPSGTLRRFGAAPHMLRRLAPRRGRGRVLCLDYGYSIQSVGPELERLGYELWLWHESLLVRRIGVSSRLHLQSASRLPASLIDELWRAVEQNPAVREAFCMDGFDLWETVAPRMRRLVEHGLPEVLEYSAAAASAFEQIRPQAVVMSMAAFAHQKAVCHAARAAGVPSLVLRHGELGTRQAPMVSYQDVDSVDWALCWGTWEEEWTQRYRRRPVRTRVVGSPMIEASTHTAPPRHTIRKRLGYRGDDPIALYVPTFAGGNYRYLGWRGSSDNTQYRQGRKVVDVLLDAYHWQVVIKEHPAVSDSPLERWCSLSHGRGRVSVIRTLGFSGLIDLADVIVLGGASTTLVQAMFGSGRIYVIDSPVLRWEPSVIHHLTEAGVVFCAVSDLAKHIRADIEAGLLSGSFSYGSEAVQPLAARSGEPGGAARRAARAIAEIACEAGGQNRTALAGLALQ